METGLEGKPIYIGAIAGVSLVIITLVAGHFLFFEKGSKNILRQKGRLEDLQKQINEGRAAERSLPQFREEVRRLELELEKLLRILPSQRGTADILRRVRSLTEQGDFELLRFAPTDPVSMSDFYSAWDISIRLEGTYHNLALFFDRISRFSRIINIENLSVKPLARRGSQHTIAAAFIAKTFLAVELPEEDL
jgi:type IV pilus assembly protein PilO